MVSGSRSHTTHKRESHLLNPPPGTVALERMDERAARKLSGLLGTTVSFPHHRARAGASGGFNRRAAAVPTSIRDRILREHDVDVRLHAWLAARDP